jgi:hypothetical protein
MLYRSRRMRAHQAIASAVIAGAALTVVSASPSVCRADGIYFVESFGVARARGRIAGMVGTALHLRLGLGMRIGNVAIEPWTASELQLDRTGAFQGIVGGEPAPGTADIHSLGLDVKYIVPVHRHLDLFARTGPLVAEGTGTLGGYRGRGVGVGGGAQLTGQVRALGFLWAPLFFVKRGPMVTGALFLDAGYDTSVLRAAHRASINAGIAHLAVGFAIGSAF